MKTSFPSAYHLGKQDARFSFISIFFTPFSSKHRKLAPIPAAGDISFCNTINTTDTAKRLSVNELMVAIGFESPELVSGLKACCWGKTLRQWSNFFFHLPFNYGNLDLNNERCLPTKQPPCGLYSLEHPSPISLSMPHNVQLLWLEELYEMLALGLSNCSLSAVVFSLD